MHKQFLANSFRQKERNFITLTIVSLEISSQNQTYSCLTAIHYEQSMVLTA